MSGAMRVTRPAAGLFSRVSAAAKNFLGGSDRKLQESADLHELQLLLSYYEGGDAAAEAAMKQAHVATWRKELEVTRALCKQARPLLESLEEVFGESSDVPVQTRLAAKIGYSLQRRPSSIPGAGDGLFLASGSLRPGQLVAFVPGLIWLPLFGREMPNYPNIAKDNDQLHVHYDGVMLDARWWDINPPEKAVEALRRVKAMGEGQTLPEPSEKPQVPAKKPKLVDMRLRPEQRDERAEREEEKQEEHAAAAEPIEPWRSPIGPVADHKARGVKIGPDRRNPLALGHLVNHPPKGGAANVIKAPSQWPRDDSSWGKLLPWIPNRYYLEGGMFTNSQPDYRAFAIVAKTHVKAGEELFMQYRFNPALAHLHPPWYWESDPEAVRRRFSD